MVIYTFTIYFFFQTLSHFRSGFSHHSITAVFTSAFVHVTRIPAIVYFALCCVNSAITAGKVLDFIHASIFISCAINRQKFVLPFIDTYHYMPDDYYNDHTLNTMYTTAVTHNPL